MSVKVQGLTKIYGQQKAVDNISFEAKQGEIVGFLGPNGAGKSTTMKIITCFLPPTSGTVSVCGHDIKENSIEVRQQIGYLPESNPLYFDMYVKEYLAFIAQLHKLGDKTKGRIEEMIALTGLEKEQKKKIGQLSKGYKQRVGLAQAMIHDPKVLILDEPISGLDPNQLIEIREVIKTLGKEKTVILSSHILQEIEAVCDKIVIINQGKLVANSSTAQLQQQSQAQTILVIEFNKSVPSKDLQNLPNVAKVETIGKNKWQLLVQGKKDIRPAIFEFAVKNQLVLLTMYQETSSLEEVFKALTGN